MGISGAGHGAVPSRLVGGLKRAIPVAQRDWLRAAARGNPYRYEQAAGPVRIGDIVSPLRYDILLRAAHFRFHSQHRDLYAGDFESYQRLAREQGYFTWFERIMVPSWLPQLVGDPQGFDAAWRERLRASAALHESFERRGFDREFPIELYAGREVLRTRTGKRTSRTLFAGDGNHRLSLLLEAGHDVLEPSEYHVKRYRSLVPSDTTGLLLKETHADWSQYESFLQLGYPSVSVSSGPGGVKVDHSDPGIAAEVRSLVPTDRPFLTGGRA